MPPVYKERASPELNGGGQVSIYQLREEQRIHSHCWHWLFTVSKGLGVCAAGVGLEHVNGIPALFKLSTQSLKMSFKQLL